VRFTQKIKAKIPIAELKFIYACIKTIFEIRQEVNSEDNSRSLKIPFLEKVTIISVANVIILWTLNPTITQSDNHQIYYRKTTGALVPVAKLNGVSRIDNPSKEFKNALMRLELSEDLTVTHNETIIDLSGPPCLEDVRAITFQERVLLVGTLVLTSSPNPWTSTVAIYDPLKNTTIQLKSPLNRRIEKNWVPIEVEGDILRLLYYSTPLHIIEVDLLSGNQKNTILNSTGTAQKPLNGGSQFVKLEDGSYVRVARKRFAILGMGRIHFNYFVHHDINLIETGRSRPFVFQTLGFEICNGIKLDGNGNIYLTWAQNDRDMFIAVCKTRHVLDFIYISQTKKNISILKSFFLIKKSRQI